MSDLRTSLGEVIPVTGFIKTFVGNILVLRQVLLILGLVYAIGFYGPKYWSEATPEANLEPLLTFIEFVFLGLLLWIIQESLNSQNRKKAVVFFFNSKEDA